MALRGLHKKEKNDIKNLRTRSELQWWTTSTKKSKSNQLFHWLYEGQIMNDKYHGYGVLAKVYKHETKKKCYAGQWVNGKMHGLGGYWYKNGSYYEGDFYKGKRWGFGRMWHHDGSFYQGFWQENLYNGRGMLIYANGNRYEGDFMDGKKTGRGIFYHLRTGQMQEGYWMSNICVQSVISDINNRQSAPQPSHYPIQILSI